MTWRALLLTLFPFLGFSQEYKIDSGTFTHSLSEDGALIHQLTQDVYDSTNIVQDEWYKAPSLDVRALIHTTRGWGPQTFHARNHSTLTWYNNGSLRSNYWEATVVPMPFISGLSVGSNTRTISNRVHSFTRAVTVRTWLQTKRCDDQEAFAAMVFLYRDDNKRAPRRQWFIPFYVTLTNGQSVTNWLPGPKEGVYWGMGCEVCASCITACWDFQWDPPNVAWRRRLQKDVSELPAAAGFAQIGIEMARGPGPAGAGQEISPGIYRLQGDKADGRKVKLTITAPPKTQYELLESFDAKNWHSLGTRTHPLGDEEQTWAVDYRPVAFYRARAIYPRKHSPPTPGPHIDGPPAFLPSPINE